jgi:hypothetical protein
MKLKEIENKEIFLKENYPFANVPKLGDKKHCLHCNKTITVGDYKVETSFNVLGRFRTRRLRFFMRISKFASSFNATKPPSF